MSASTLARLLRYSRGASQAQHPWFLTKAVEASEMPEKMSTRPNSLFILLIPSFFPSVGLDITRL